MFCQRCGAQNPADARFCGNCGLPLAAPPVGAPPHPPEQAPPAGPPAQPMAPPYQPPVAPPAAPQYQPPAAVPPQYQPPAAPPQQYTPPPQYTAPPQFAPPPMYTDGNTSGSGQAYPVPQQASGGTAAGFVWFGAFAFANGITAWGVVGLILSLVGLAGMQVPWLGLVGLVYIIYIATKGKDMAWRSRRFATTEQYVQTMRVWNGWGWAFLVLDLICILSAFAWLTQSPSAVNW